MRMSISLRRSALAVTAVAAIVLAGSSGGAQAAGQPFGNTAQGTVFYPNPVTQLGNQNLPDAKDADDPAFAAAYRRVVLQDLDASGTLTGRYVVVKSKTGKP